MQYFKNMNEEITRVYSVWRIKKAVLRWKVTPSEEQCLKLDRWQGPPRASKVQLCRPWRSNQKRTIFVSWCTCINILYLHVADPATSPASRGVLETSFSVWQQIVLLRYGTKKEKKRRRKRKICASTFKIQCWNFSPFENEAVTSRMGVVCFGVFLLLLFFSKVPHKKPQKPTKKKQPAAHLPLHNSISAPDPLVTLLVISHDHTSSYNPNTCSFFFFFFFWWSRFPPS